MHRLLFLVLFFYTFLFFTITYSNDRVLGSSTYRYWEDNELESAKIVSKIDIKTQTAFDQKIIEEYENIPYETEYEKDDDMEYGTQETVRDGVDGKKTYEYLLTYWIEDIIDKTLLSTNTKESINEVIAKGTKIVWKMFSTPDVGRVKYWYKMRVWATKYDANCIGCTGRTYSGTEVVKGVCATDPKVIPLGTNFYVEGYGLCRAEDIGGAIKGEKIDLGYKDASKGEWRTGYTNIYLLTNAPEE